MWVFLEFDEYQFNTSTSVMITVGWSGKKWFVKIKWEQIFQPFFLFSLLHCILNDCIVGGFPFKIFRFRYYISSNFSEKHVALELRSCKMIWKFLKERMTTWRASKITCGKDRRTKSDGGQKPQLYTLPFSQSRIDRFDFSHCEHFIVVYKSKSLTINFY